MEKCHPDSLNLSYVHAGGRGNSMGSIKGVKLDMTYFKVPDGQLK